MFGIYFLEVTEKKFEQIRTETELLKPYVLSQAFFSIWVAAIFFKFLVCWIILCSALNYGDQARWKMQDVPFSRCFFMMHIWKARKKENWPGVSWCSSVDRDKEFYLFQNNQYPKFDWSQLRWNYDSS